MTEVWVPDHVVDPFFHILKLDTEPPVVEAYYAGRSSVCVVTAARAVPTEPALGIYVNQKKKRRESIGFRSFGQG